MSDKYPKPNKAEFKRVCDELDEGQQLTLSHLGRVFGPQFWEMIVIMLMDANEAGRAIQNAVWRLRKDGDPTPEEEVH